MWPNCAAPCASVRAAARNAVVRRSSESAGISSSSSSSLSAAAAGDDDADQEEAVHRRPRDSDSPSAVTAVRWARRLECRRCTRAVAEAEAACDALNTAAPKAARVSRSAAREWCRPYSSNCSRRANAASSSSVEVDTGRRRGRRRRVVRGWWWWRRRRWGPRWRWVQLSPEQRRRGVGGYGGAVAAAEEAEEAEGGARREGVAPAVVPRRRGHCWRACAAAD